MSTISIKSALVGVALFGFVGLIAGGMGGHVMGYNQGLEYTGLAQAEKRSAESYDKLKEAIVHLEEMSCTAK